LNTAVADLLRARIAGVIAQAAALSAVQHSGLRGQLRELLAAGLLRPLLPPGFGIATGEIVSAYNNHSPQIDIIVYDRAKVPPLLVDEAIGLVPIEAAIATIEVKSRLTVPELRSAHESAKKIQELPFAPPSDGTKHTPLAPLTALFAFASDLTETTELDRYQSEGGAESHGLLQVCVVGRSTFYRNGKGWQIPDCGGVHGEVLAFIACFLNRLPVFADSRRRPNLLEYYGLERMDAVVPL
jgi:hypothetical protein